MMLLYKAWRESQSRFLVSALALAGYCAFMVLFRREMEGPFSVSMVGRSYSEYVNNLIFGGTGKIVFALPVMFIGLGGLLRERARHTEIFTLSLPVSRAQLVCAQIAVGLTELALLALIPALLIHPLSALVYQSYPFAQALRYSCLRFICGIFIFAISFLLSVVLKGEYTAVLATYFATFLPARADQWSPFLRQYLLNPMSTMDGRWNRLSSVNDPFPWMGLSILMFLALSMLLAATGITRRQNI